MRAFPLALLVSVLVLFTACSGRKEAVLVEEEPQSAPAGESVASCSPLYGGGVFDEEQTSLISGGGLSDQLRGATSGWNTDWSRHTIEYDEIISGGPPRDGIPSVDDPQFESFDEADEWLVGTVPVIALEINGSARAYPLPILTRHEIVNDVVGGAPVAVTFCPLCNSALVFDSCIDGQPVEFGVSGLLRNSDLLMYDRATESLWQQFTGTGVVGLHAGHQLGFIPAGLISYDDFKTTYPDGMVLSRNTGTYNPASYGGNPYVEYDTLGRRPFLFYGDPDPRLDAMLRIVGVVVDDVAVAYPYDLLGELSVIQDTVNGQDIVIFHQFGTNSALDVALISRGEDVGATGVFIPDIDGKHLTFTVDDAGQIVDEDTGSVWNVSGLAISGELEGKQLERHLSTDHFWFSWAAFYPETTVWSPE